MIYKLGLFIININLINITFNGLLFIENMHYLRIFYQKWTFHNSVKYGCFKRKWHDEQQSSTRLLKNS